MGSGTATVTCTVLGEFSTLIKLSTVCGVGSPLIHVFHLGGRALLRALALVRKSGKVREVGVKCGMVDLAVREVGSRLFAVPLALAALLMNENRHNLRNKEKRGNAKSLLHCKYSTIPKMVQYRKRYSTD